MSDKHLSAIVEPMSKLMGELEIAMIKYYGTRRDEMHKTITQRYLDRMYICPNSERDILGILNKTTESICTYLRLDVPRMHLDKDRTDEKIGALKTLLQQLGGKQSGDELISIARQLADMLAQEADRLCDIYDPARILCEK